MEQFSDTQINEILHATGELRKDPEQRAKEELQETIEKWRNQNQGIYDELMDFNN